jgi:hypothetical protein
MAVTATRLPGITFEARTPPIPTDLPRMDIAGFVGFAASGPVNVPVAVEDPVRFHDVFGEDVALARDEESGAPLFADLPAAVRAFFKNGGIRCWIVRVAGPDAVVNRFVVPGLLSARSDSRRLGAALGLARSPGRWSDSLTVNAVLLERRLAVSAAGGQFMVGGLAAGDLVQTDYGTTETAGIVGFQTPSAERNQRGPLTVAVPSSVEWWFRRATRADVDPTPIAARAPIAWLANPLRTQWLIGTAAPAADPELPVARFGVRDGGFIVEIDRSPTTDQLQAGSWLKLELTSAPLDAQPSLLMQVDRVQAAEHTASPPAGGESIWAIASRSWWVLDTAKAVSKVAGVKPRARAVTFELRVRDASDGVSRLPGLGFTRAHALYWGDVPDDERLFRQDASLVNRSDRPSQALIDAVSRPRFPLSAPAMDTAVASQMLFLPLGLDGVLDDSFDQPPLPQTGDADSRDGLKAFSPALFLDAELAATSATKLLAESFQIQYVNQYPRSGQRVGRPLTGLHALMPIDEVSVVAVPDAVQRPWLVEPSIVEPLGPPTLIEISHRLGTTHLAWTAPITPSPSPPDTLTYAVEASFDPRFARIARTWDVDDLVLEHASDEFPGCPATLFYRVRAVSETLGAGPWSNTLRDVVPPSAFEPCAADTFPAPGFLTVTETRGRLVVEWGTVGADAVVYTLERASDPAFASATVAYRGALATYEVLRGVEPIVYFRVAADVDGHRSPWSITAVAGLVESSAFVTEPAASYDESPLLGVHAALVRMCAARGDLHAVLALPQHFRDDRALAYVERLSQTIRTFDSERTLSYASVFHPWLVVRETAGRADLATFPIAPDGAVCGTIAARTLMNGAWYSPAYQVLHGVLTVQPALGDAVVRLLDARINPIRQLPQGFVALDALTLFPGDEYGDMHVRRLLILLRRLAVREGTVAVFDNNDDSLRRLMQREFEQVLGNLFVRGAFAGTTHDEGYRVITDASVNPRQSIDQGRFIVELQVAPSHPLMFLTLRLVQEGGTIVGVEEN